MDAKSGPSSLSVDSDHKDDEKEGSYSKESYSKEDDSKVDGRGGHSSDDIDIDADDGRSWWRVADFGLPREGERLHTGINGRFITIFRQRGVLSSIDAVCHHAGGPLTLGPIQDIEDLDMTVVLCPWHRFMVSIHDGTKAYQKVEIVGGKPTIAGWVKGKMVQRAHNVKETSRGVFVSMNLDSDIECSSDKDACNALCMQGYDMHNYVPTLTDL